MQPSMASKRVQRQRALFRCSIAVLVLIGGVILGVRTVSPPVTSVDFHMALPARNHHGLVYSVTAYPIDTDAVAGVERCADGHITMSVHSEGDDLMWDAIHSLSILKDDIPSLCAF